jgi:hypothetical protein
MGWGLPTGYIEFLKKVAHRVGVSLDFCAVYQVQVMDLFPLCEFSQNGDKAVSHGSWMDLCAEHRTW